MDWSKSQLQVSFKQLRSFLPEEEEIEYAAVARNAPNSLYIRPCLLATDRRLIYLEPKMLGLSSTPHGYEYHDFGDIHIDKGFFTHKISLTPYPGRGIAAIVVDHLEKRRSVAFYEYVSGRIGQPPVPELPATSAQSKPAVASQRPPISAAQETDPLVIKLTQLKKLHEEGLLTDEEFSAMKAKVLREI
jgi:hypothetical protein